METEKWDNSVSHVIAKLEPDKEGLPEKVMGAIAGGKWVLTKVMIFDKTTMYLSNLVSTLEVRGEKLQSRQFSADSPAIFEPETCRRPEQEEIPPESARGRRDVHWDEGTGADEG